MTVPSTTSAVSYTGTGSTATYPYTWQIAQAADLVVYTLTAAGALTKLALTTDYTVSGAGVPTGGTVTLVAGSLATGTVLFIASDPLQVQALLLQQGAAFNPGDVMNALDLLTRQTQANRRTAGNAIQVPVAESLLGRTTVLPPAQLRANMWLGFDAQGNALALAGSAPPFTDTIYSVLSFKPARNGITDDSSVIQTAINAASAAGARVVYLPAGRYAVGAHITVPSGITVRGDGMGQTVLVVLSSLPLTSSVFQNANPPIGGVRQNANIAFEKLSVDGSGRSYPAYLSDPATGLPIVNPAVNTTRNPAYNTLGSIFQMDAVDGLIFNEVEIYGHQSIGIYDRGGRYVRVVGCRFHGNGKVDYISSPVYSQGYGNVAIITGITKANPAVVTVDNPVFINGQQIQITGVRGLAHVPDGVYTVAGVSGSTFQLQGIDTSGDSGFVFTGQQTAWLTTYVPSQDVRIIDSEFYDNLRSAITFAPQLGGIVTGCTFRNNGESTVFCQRARSLIVSKNRLYKSTLTDIVSRFVEVVSCTDVQVEGNHFEQSEREAVAFFGVIGGRIAGNTMRNIIRTASLTFPYGPLAESWTGSAIGSPDIAGTSVDDKAYVRISSIGAMPCASIVITGNVMIDDRDTKLTTRGVYLSKSGTDNIVSDLCIADNDFVRAGLSDANIVAMPTTATALLHTVSMRGNIGHSSENPVVLTGTFANGVTGVQSLAFGFTPRLVILKVFPIGTTNVRMSESWIARDRVNTGVGTLGMGGLFAIDAIATAPASDQTIINQDAWDVRNAANTAIHHGEFVSWDINGMSVNVTIATLDARYVAVAYP